MARMSTLHVGGIDYRVTAAVHLDIAGGGQYRIEPGFVFNVSVPKLLRWLFDPHDPAYHIAAAKHDHMLKNGWSPAVAAAEFHDELRRGGVSPWRCWTMFIGVTFRTVG